MNDFFKLNSPAMKFLTSIANLIIVNLIFIVTCIPVITIGAALSSLYTVCFEIINGEEVFLFKDYFSTFKNTFLKATAIWVPLLLIDGFLLFEVYIILAGFPGTAPWMMIPLWIVIVLSFCIAIYAFPILSRFENTFKETIKNAFLLSIGNFPTTVMIAVIHFAAFLGLTSGNYFSVILASLFFFFGCSLLALITTVFLNHTLPKSSAVMSKYVEEDTKLKKENIFR